MTIDQRNHPGNIMFLQSNPGRTKHPARRCAESITVLHERDQHAAAYKISTFPSAKRPRKIDHSKTITCRRAKELGAVRELQRPELQRKQLAGEEYNVQNTFVLFHIFGFSK